MKMRGIYSSVTDIRRKVFTEVARLAYEEGDYAEKIAELPYKIVPGSKAVYRESIFLERAIVEERLRLAIGLPLRPIEEHKSVADGIEESAIAEKYYDPPLVNIIKFACNGCPETHYHVTDCCQGCLAHPCQEVCPKGAITIKHGKSVIDQSKCIKCGRCQSVCPYNAINKMERPCARACGMDAIGSDEEGKAKIDYDKCVSCGMCLVNCPFGAIVDKGQIFQLITAMKKKKKVIAIVAPAFVGQFGPKASPEKLTAAMKKLGFADVKDRHYDEHMILEMKDGSLRMFVRTKYGIGASNSYDGGRSWSKDFDTGYGGPCSRFHITRLRSGRILLINHFKFSGRNNLTAMLSEDEGKTFPYKLLLDEREVSYPDAKEADDGFIYVTYDRERGSYLSNMKEVMASAREILIAKITEEDIISGSLANTNSYLKRIASKLTDYDGEDKDPFHELDFDKTKSV